MTACGRLLGRHNKAAQSGRRKRRKFVLSRLWRPEVQDRGAAGLVFPSLFLWFIGGRLLPGPSRGRPSVCVCVLNSSYKDASRWGKAYPDDLVSVPSSNTPSPSTAAFRDAGAHDSTCDFGEARLSSGSKLCVAGSHGGARPASQRGTAPCQHASVVVASFRLEGQHGRL